jgi:hypothetical protein
MSLVVMPCMGGTAEHAVLHSNVPPVVNRTGGTDLTVSSARDVQKHAGVHRVDSTRRLPTTTGVYESAICIARSQIKGGYVLPALTSG